MNKRYILLLTIIFVFSAISKVSSEGTHKRSSFKENLTFAPHLVKGKVLDSKTNEPIIGATIVVKGTNQGTLADVDGNFSISVPDSGAILVVSYIGYKKQEIPVINKMEFIISLEAIATDLDEVVVIGYGVQKKADLIGAVSTVNAKDINSTPVMNVSQAIQGRAAGIQIVPNSGAPGSEISIKIRGTGTVNNSDPLYVVDGMVVESISYLNSEDIQDLQILKDASSAAIYGARAANGVVLITTKKGQKGDVHISFNAYWGKSEFWNKPNINDKEGYRALYDSVYHKPLLVSKGDKYLFTNYAANNWLDYIIRNGLTQKYNLQVSGGNEKNTYLVSGSWSGDKGIIQKAGYNKKSIRIYSENQILKWLTLRSNLQATGSDRTIVEEGQYNIFQYALNEAPSNTLYDVSTTGTNFIYDEAKDSLSYFNKVLRWSPYTRLFGTDKSSTTGGYIGNFELFSKISKSLTNSTRAGFDLEYFSESDFGIKNTDPYTYFTNGDLGIKYDQNVVSRTENKKTKWQFEDVLTFSKKIHKHTITVIGGISLEGYKENQMYASRAMAPDAIGSLQELDATYVNPQINGWGKEWKAIGIPFRVDYNFAEKYLFQFNLRADASSVFSANKRWGYFPSVSLGWKLNEESFLKQVDWLSLLKVRATWGVSGNNRIDEYASQTILQSNPSYYYVLGKNPFYKPGWAASGIGNSNIVWEKTTATNGGIDVSLFQGSLNATLEVFDKRTSNMLLQLPVVLSSGMTDAPWQNAGEVRNYGYEITSSFKKKIQDFSFDVGFNFTKIFNNVEKLGKNGEPIWGGYQDINSEAIKSTYLTYTAVGHPIGQFYGWKIDRSLHANGIWRQEDKDANFAGKALPTSPSNVIAGDYIFKDLNGDGKIDESDKTYLGSPLPNFSYGFNFFFKYKAVDLTMFFQGVYGNKIFNMEKYWLEAFHYSNNNNTAKDLLANSWSASNQDAKYPMLRKVVDNNNNYRVSDFYIEDGSYLRLKNLQIGFTLPPKWDKLIRVSSLRLYVGAYNLLTFTKYSGFDPEIGNTSNTAMGIDLGSFPQARTYMGGILVDF